MDWDLPFLWYAQVGAVLALIVAATWMLRNVTRRLYYSCRRVAMTLSDAHVPIFIGDTVTLNVFAPRVMPGEYLVMRKAGAAAPIKRVAAIPAVSNVSARTHTQSMHLGGPSEDDMEERKPALYEDFRVTFSEARSAGAYDVQFLSADGSRVLQSLRIEVRVPTLHASVDRTMLRMPVTASLTCSWRHSPKDYVVLLRTDALGIEDGTYLPVPQPKAVPPPPALLPSPAGTAHAASVNQQGGGGFSVDVSFTGRDMPCDPGAYELLYLRSHKAPLADPATGVSRVREQGRVLARSGPISVVGPSVAPQLAVPACRVACMVREPLTVHFEASLHHAAADAVVLLRGEWTRRGAVGAGEGGLLASQTAATEGRWAEAAEVARVPIPKGAAAGIVTFPAGIVALPGVYSVLYLDGERRRVMHASTPFLVQAPLLAAVGLQRYALRGAAGCAGAAVGEEEEEVELTVAVPGVPFRTAVTLVVLASRSRGPRDAVVLCRAGERPASESTHRCLLPLPPPPPLSGGSAGAGAASSDLPHVIRGDSLPSGSGALAAARAALGPLAACGLGEMLFVTFDPGAGTAPRVPGLYTFAYIAGGAEVAHGVTKHVPAARLAVVAMLPVTVIPAAGGSFGADDASANAQPPLSLVVSRELHLPSVAATTGHASVAEARAHPRAAAALGMGAAVWGGAGAGPTQHLAAGAAAAPSGAGNKGVMSLLGGLFGPSAPTADSHWYAWGPVVAVLGPLLSPLHPPIHACVDGGVDGDEEEDKEEAMATAELLSADVATERERLLLSSHAAYAAHFESQAQQYAAGVAAVTARKGAAPAADAAAAVVAADPIAIAAASPSTAAPLLASASLHHDVGALDYGGAVSRPLVGDAAGVEVATVHLPPSAPGFAGVDYVALAPAGGPALAHTATAVPRSGGAEGADGGGWGSGGPPSCRVLFDGATRAPQLPGLWQFVYLAAVDEHAARAVAAAALGSAGSSCAGVGIGGCGGVELRLWERRGKAPCHTLHARAPSVAPCLAGGSFLSHFTAAPAPSALPGYVVSVGAAGDGGTTGAFSGSVRYIEAARSAAFAVRPPRLQLRDDTFYPPPPPVPPPVAAPLEASAAGVASDAPAAAAPGGGLLSAISSLFGAAPSAPSAPLPPPPPFQAVSPPAQPPRPRLLVSCTASLGRAPGDALALAPVGGDPELDAPTAASQQLLLPRVRRQRVEFAPERGTLPLQAGAYQLLYLRGGCTQPAPLPPGHTAPAAAAAAGKSSGSSWFSGSAAPRGVGPLPPANLPTPSEIIAAGAAGSRAGVPSGPLPPPLGGRGGSGGGVSFCSVSGRAVLCRSATFYIDAAPDGRISIRVPSDVAAAAAATGTAQLAGIEQQFNAAAAAAAAAVPDHGSNIRVAKGLAGSASSYVPPADVPAASAPPPWDQHLALGASMAAASPSAAPAPVGLYPAVPPAKSTTGSPASAPAVRLPAPPALPMPPISDANTAASTGSSSATASTTGTSTGAASFTGSGTSSNSATSTGTGTGRRSDTGSGTGSSTWTSPAAAAPPLADDGVPLLAAPADPHSALLAAIQARGRHPAAAATVASAAVADPASPAAPRDQQAAAAAAAVARPATAAAAQKDVTPATQSLPHQQPHPQPTQHQLCVECEAAAVMRCGACDMTYCGACLGAVHFAPAAAAKLAGHAATFAAVAAPAAAAGRALVPAARDNAGGGEAAGAPTMPAAGPAAMRRRPSAEEEAAEAVASSAAADVLPPHLEAYWQRFRVGTPGPAVLHAMGRDPSVSPADVARLCVAMKLPPPDIIASARAPTAATLSTAAAAAAAASTGGGVAAAAAAAAATRSARAAQRPNPADASSGPPPPPPAPRPARAPKLTLVEQIQARAIARQLRSEAPAAAAVGTASDAAAAATPRSPPPAAVGGRESLVDTMRRGMQERRAALAPRPPVAAGGGAWDGGDDDEEEAAVASDGATSRLR